MKCFTKICLVVLLFISVQGCVRKHPSYSTPNRQRIENRAVDDVPIPTKRVMERQRSTVAGSLLSRVKALASKVGRAYRNGRVSAGDLAEWADQYLAFCTEYALSLNKLSDHECEEIEYNLGKIAGLIYRDSVAPILEEVEDISQGMEEYETRSQKWKGAAKKGFEDVTGQSLDDLFGNGSY